VLYHNAPFSNIGQTQQKLRRGIPVSSVKDQVVITLLNAESSGERKPTGRREIEKVAGNFNPLQRHLLGNISH